MNIVPAELADDLPDISFDVSLMNRFHGRWKMVMQVQYPMELPDLLGESPQEFEQEARRAMAMKLFELGRVSSGAAADLAEMNRVDFLLLLSQYGVSAMNIAPTELADDLRNA